MNSKKKEKLRIDLWTQSLCAALNGLLSNSSLEMSFEQTMELAKDYADSCENAFLQNLSFEEEIRINEEEEVIFFKMESNKYFRHLDDCAKIADPKAICSCGLDSLAVPKWLKH